MNWKITILLVLLAMFFIACSVEGAAHTKTRKAKTTHAKTTAKTTVKKTAHKTKSHHKTTTKKTTSKTTAKKTTAKKTTAAKVVTICAKYATKLKMTQVALMYTIINKLSAVVTNPNNILAQYFNGTTPPGSRNFLDPANIDFLKLLDHRFVAFFGALMGCNAPGFPVFEQSGNFRRIHQRMHLNITEFDVFVIDAGVVLKNVGFDQSDISTVAKIIGLFKSRVVYTKRIPAASITGFPPVPSAAVAKTTAKTTTKKTTVKKTKSHHKTTAKKTKTHNKKSHSKKVKKSHSKKVKKSHSKKVKKSHSKKK